MKRFFVWLLYLHSTTCYSQHFNQQALIGKLCPDIVLAKGFHLPSGKRSIRDFRGQPLILYFYTTRCLACLHTFPHVDSLLKQFAGRISIVMVGREGAEQVAQTFRSRKSLEYLSVPTVVEDTALHRVFRHIAVPHVVLIDKEGIVKAITGSLNTETLRRMIKQDPLQVNEKRDAVDKDPDDPMLYTDWVYQKDWKSVYSATYIAKANPATAIIYGGRRDTTGILYRWVDVGTLSDLYQRVYPALRDINVSRVFLEGKGMAELLKDSTSYSFDVIRQNMRSDDSFYALARNTLDEFFGIQSHVEKRSVTCWILRKSTGKLPLSSGKKWQLDYLGDSLKFTATTWPSFVNIINGIKLTPPYQILDETGIDAKERYDITISTAITNKEAISHSLTAYGIALVEEKRELDCLILTKK